MAKHSVALSRPVIVMQRPPSRARRAARRVVHHARRAGHAARAGAPTGAIVLAAAALGYGKQKGWLDKLPVVGGSKTITLGIAGFVARKYSGNAHIKNLGLAAMVAAAFDFGRVQGGGAAGEEGDDGPLGEEGEDI